jgi:hypothetical protein
MPPEGHAWLSLVALLLVLALCAAVLYAVARRGRRD